MRNATIVREIQQRVRRHLIPLLTATLLIAVTTFAVLALRPTPSGVPALVTKIDLQAGESVTTKNAAVILLPKAAVPDEAMSGFEQTDGDDLQHNVARGEILRYTDFTDNTSGVPPGRSRIVLELPANSQGFEAGDAVEIWGPSDACVSPESPIGKLASDATVEQVNEMTTGAFQGNANAQISFLVASLEVGQVLCASTQGGLHIVVAGR
ncbi:MAG: hypothetical protein WAS54_00905 [Scrofimicrobium sp.]